MYLSFYNLKRKPFRMSTDPTFLWFGEKHKEALATLKYAIFENKGILALTGDVGTGKTTLINALIQSLGEDTITVTIYDPNLEAIDFFNVIATALNMERTFESKAEFIIHFRKFLGDVRDRKQKVLLIIDEAQGIHPKLFEEIRLLSNLEADYIRLLNIFFVGQNELIDILRAYENRALRQRITITYHIEPLILSETEAYIRHRLDISGAKTRIFSPGAIEEIFAFSGGYPRLINIICDHALLSGYVRDIKIIDADIIRECKEELLISKKAPERDSAFLEDDPQAAFKLVSPIGKPAVDQWYDKPHILPLVLAMALFMVIGTVSGYVYYHSGEIRSKTPVSDARKQKGMSRPMKKTSEKNKTATVSPGAETPKKPEQVLSGKDENPRFFIIRSPEPKLFKEIAPQKTESPDAQPSALPADKTAIQTSPEKTGELKSPGSQRTVEAGKTGEPVILPTDLQKSEVSMEEAPAETEKTVPVPAGPNKEKRAVPSAADNMSNKTEMSISSSMGVRAPPEATQAGREDSAEPVQKSRISKDKAIPVDTENQIPGDSETHVKRVKIERKLPPLSSGLTEKQVGASAGESRVKPSPETAASERDETGVDQMVAPKEQWVVVGVPSKKKSGIQSDEEVLLLNWPEREPEPGGEPTSSEPGLEDRLKTFLSDYCRTYEQKDLVKFSTFFALDALEKGKPFSSLLYQYRQNFNQVDSMNYTIELDRYATQPTTGLVRIEGTFQEKDRLNGDENWQQKDGQISMVLERDNDSFKIKRLEYENFNPKITPPGENGKEQR